MESFNLFNIGFGELTFILIMAGLVMGPQRIRQVARYLGQLTNRLQRISREFRRQLNAELDAVEREEFRDAVADIRALQQEVADLRRELIAGPRKLAQEGERAMKPEPEADPQIGPVPTREPQPPESNGTSGKMPKLIDVEDDPV